MNEVRQSQPTSLLDILGPPLTSLYQTHSIKTPMKSFKGQDLERVIETSCRVRLIYNDLIRIKE